MAPMEGFLFLLISVLLVSAAPADDLASYRDCSVQCSADEPRCFDQCAPEVPPDSWFLILESLASDAVDQGASPEAVLGAWVQDKGPTGDTMLGLLNGAPSTQGVLEALGIAWGPDANLALESTFNMAAAQGFPDFPDDVAMDAQKKWVTAHRTSGAFLAMIGDREKPEDMPPGAATPGMVILITGTIIAASAGIAGELVAVSFTGADAVAAASVVSNIRMVGYGTTLGGATLRILEWMFPGFPSPKPNHDPPPRPEPTPEPQPDTEPSDPQPDPTPDPTPDTDEPEPEPEVTPLDPFMEQNEEGINMLKAWGRICSFAICFYDDLNIDPEKLEASLMKGGLSAQGNLILVSPVDEPADEHPIIDIACIESGCQDVR